MIDSLRKRLAVYLIRLLIRIAVKTNGKCQM